MKIDKHCTEDCLAKRTVTTIVWNSRVTYMQVAAHGLDFYSFWISVVIHSSFWISVVTSGTINRMRF